MKKIINTLIAVVALIGLCSTQPTALAQQSTKEEQKQLLATIQSDTSDLHSKVVALKRLAVIGDADVVPVVSKLLYNEQLHHMARFALEPNPSPAVDVAFREALDKLNGKLLIGVINSIGIRRDRGATSKLIALLKSADKDVAGAAGAALARIGNVDCAKALSDAFKSAEGALKLDLADSIVLCAENLTKAGNNSEAIQLYDLLRSSNVPAHIKMAATRGAITARKEKGIPLLIEALNSSDDGLFAVALTVTREIQDKQVNDVLVKQYQKLESEKVFPQRLAGLMEAIGDKNDKRIIKFALSALSENKDQTLQLTAIRVINKLGDESVVPVLLQTAAKKDSPVSRPAYNCLITLSGQKVENAIRKAINSGNEETACVAINIISERNVQSAIPDLISAGNSKNRNVKLTAVKALGVIASDQYLNDLIKILLTTQDKEELVAVEESISAICNRSQNKDKCAQMVLSPYAKANTAIKCSILNILPQAPCEKSLSAVRSAMNDTNNEIRDAAIRALCQWQTANALDDIIKVAKTTGDQRIKLLALRAIINIVDQTEMNPNQKSITLKQTMDIATQNAEKNLVLSALANAPTPDTLALAESCLDNNALQNEAAFACVAIIEKLPDKDKKGAISILKKISSMNVDGQVKKRAQNLLKKLNQ